MPVGSEFRGPADGSYVRGVRAFAARLRDELQVPVADAWDWLDDESFADMHHLTAAGAQAFSARFAAECLTPLLDGVGR